MSITFDEYYKYDYDDDFEFPDDIAGGAVKEYSHSPEVHASFKSFFSYYTKLVETVCSSERVEYYLKDSDCKRFSAIVIQVYSDIHYGAVAAASVLWIPKGFRNDPEVSKVIVSIFRKFCKEYGIRYYKRVTKVTPYVHKHIVKEVK